MSNEINGIIYLIDSQNQHQSSKKYTILFTS